MKMKNLLLITAVLLGITAATLAQNLPSYVPTDGLVGWWPFNGNANDESGNGNDGVVNGATLTSDRDAQSNMAYDFDGETNYIVVPNHPSLNLENPNEFTISYWINPASLSSSQLSFVVIKQNEGGTNQDGFNSGVDLLFNSTCRIQNGPSTNSFTFVSPSNSITEGNWVFVCQVWNGAEGSTYLNDNLVGQSLGFAVAGDNSSDLKFGLPTFPASNSKGLDGKIDDIGIWHRALTPQEITDLYNSIDCANNTTITPSTNSLTIGSTATFSAISSDPNPSFFWQSNLGQGFQTLNEYGQYSGVSTADLSISNVQLSEHLQQVRAISTSGNCVDTSNVAIINILDTCITNISIYDTLFTSVTDTLVITTQITGINTVDIQNTIKVFPNPTNTHITIDYGNYSAMSGYMLRITNSLGAEVFNTSINQQTSDIDLGSWSGNGLYFVHIIDPQGNTIDIRKIVLQ